MLKFLRQEAKESSEESDSLDADLSDFQEEHLEKELEMKDVSEQLESKSISSKKDISNKSTITTNNNNNNNNNNTIPLHELGRERIRMAKKQEVEKKKLKEIVDKALPHPNERPRKAQYIHNKQRTLIFSTRGINQRMRHLMQDLRDLIPHSKSEPKLETKKSLTTINEICDERNCNNCIFFESHRHTDLYMWISRIPNGPSCKFLVTNIHTMGELKLTGNSLKGSRPLLVFDKKFDDHIQFKLIREMLMQTFGTPYGHPKSKPFIDHVFSFMICDNKIWFRNYQIVFDADSNANIDNNQPNPVLVEIGPRFVLHPVKIHRGSFQGTTIYQDGNFINPNAERRAVKTQKRLVSASELLKKRQEEEYANGYATRQFQKLQKKEREHMNQFDYDPEKLDDVFSKGITLKAPKRQTMQVDNTDQKVKEDNDDDDDIDIDIDMDTEMKDSTDIKSQKSSQITEPVSNFLED